MSKRFLFIILWLFFLAPSANALTYLAYEEFGGEYYDADKTFAGDTNMCWAAAMSNVLMYSGWDAGYSSEDEIFREFKDHWENEGGYSTAALDYWFYGLDTTSAQRMDVPGGGGYYTEYDYAEFFHHVTFRTSDNQLSYVERLLRTGAGVELAFDTSFNMGHALTCYGLEYDDFGNYSGVWVVENNDTADNLKLLKMESKYIDMYKSDMWIVNEGSYNGWVINTTIGLDAFPASSPVPEPGTIFLFGSGLCLFYCRSRKRAS